MLRRLVWNLVTLASLTVLGGVAYYFFAEYQGVELRLSTVRNLKQQAKDEGPCAALMEATRLADAADDELDRNLDELRGRFVAEVLGNGDKRSERALLSATRDGLISHMVCEQIALLASGGEVHPVLALLRFTREKDPCEEAMALDKVIDGLGSHRAILLRGLMEDPGRLKCLTPAMSQELSGNVVRMMRDDPQAFDDLDVLRIAAYLNTWVPMQAAQIGCRIEAVGDISRLGQALGCGAEQRSSVLTHYRYAHEVAGARGGAALPKGSEVMLLWEADGRCEVRPMVEPPRVIKVACGDLELISGVEVAVLAENVRYGAVRADLISGIASYEGTSRVVSASKKEPEVRTWYAYDRNGQPLGTTRVVSLDDLALQFGEELPPSPLRAFCKAAGAAFCYDVDWSQLVAKVQGPATVFLSRPLPVFLRDATLPAESLAALYRDAFGHAPAVDATVRMVALGEEGHLLADVKPDGFELRWRTGAGGAWSAQSFGVAAGGVAPPAARLFALMDMQGDGKPELVLQRSERQLVRGELKQTSDEIVLLELDNRKGAFMPVTTLTIHEY